MIWKLSTVPTPLFRLWIWELLCITLQHVTGHVERASQALESLQLRSASRKKIKDPENEDVEVVFRFLANGFNKHLFLMI